ncbi:DSBA-like thioredoxin domain protein [Gimesia maris]|uniref:DsbA family oxidoreductase n=1 Tax=Gimesia maris TaxID=122 RepID=UPI001188972D|nr:DsbA family oxidoreductase [Gimesia maris]QDT78650.1 DSBA-like thioredoxin domain protein [Gimesia maris]
MQLSVDVISDVICPWCYIGKRRLEKAIRALDDQYEIQVRWHPFQLNPLMPKAGISRKEYRTKKFGSWERSTELDARVVAVGAVEGIHFHFDAIDKTPNTVDAHRLIGWAEQHGCQDKVVESLFQAYFVEGQDIGNHQTLIQVVSAAGLNPQAAEALLLSDDGMDAMDQGKILSQRHQIDSVPSFIIDRKITISGAEQAEVFLTAFTQIAAAT